MIELSGEQLQRLRGKLDNLDRTTHETRDKINELMGSPSAQIGPDLGIYIDKVADRAIEFQREFQRMLTDEN